MKRRAFITLLGGAAVAWPLAARAQQRAVRRIGVLMNLAAEDPESSLRIAVFLQSLQGLGWTVGRNLRLDIRWGAGDPNRYRSYAAELVALEPDMILVSGAATGPLQQTTSTVPIVFVHVVDPVGAGFVASLARPGGNITGFTQFEFGMSAKWLELLKQIVPGVTRVAVLRDPTIGAGTAQLAAMQSVAPALGVELVPADVRRKDEIERTIQIIFGGGSSGGLVITSSTLAIIHRDQIIALAARHKLPAVYPSRLFITSGGLASYGPDPHDMYRRVAGYVDRVLMGEKPADLPVQGPTKYELVINLKTAKVIGLEVPPTLLARADEVIE